MIQKFIQVGLDQDLLRDLEKIRKHLGLKNDSEVVRYLIREKAREIQNVTPVTAAEEV